VLPTLLFSGAFFPVSQRPVGIEQAAYVTPLWHGVDLCRDLALGQGSFAWCVGHVAYLAACPAGGYVVGVRMYARGLAPLPPPGWCCRRVCVSADQRWGGADASWGGPPCSSAGTCSCSSAGSSWRCSTCSRSASGSPSSSWRSRAPGVGRPSTP